MHAVCDCLSVSSDRRRLFLYRIRYGIMVIKMFDSLKEIDVISDDAYVVGSITDVNYSSETWDVHSLFVRGVKGLGDILGASALRKLQFSLVIGDYALNDVLLVPEVRDQLQRVLASGENDCEKVGTLIGKTVLSLDEIPMGTIEDVSIDTDAWKINSFKVKLDKNVAGALDIKLGLLNKTASGLLTNHVESVTKTVNLAYRVEELRGYFTLD